MNKLEALISAFVILFVSFMTVSTTILAKSDGISGYSTVGCICHSSNFSPSVGVTISGRTIVVPDTTYAYTVTVSGGPLAANGLDVSITNGTLAVTDSTNTQLLETEIAQTVAGMSQISWSFDWTSPSTYGSVTMHVAGFSGDGDGRKDQDDLWNTASLTIVVSVLGDCDGDRDVDYDDFMVLAGAYGSSSEDPAFVQATDFDADGDVDYDDFIALAGNYGKSV